MRSYQLRAKKKESLQISTQKNNANNIEANQNNYYQTTQFVHTPYQELDLEAINNERVFFWRFYLKKNLSERSAIIALQRLHDLTSLQISLLHLTNNVGQENNQLIIKQNQVIYRTAQSVFIFHLLFFVLVLTDMAFKQNLINLQFWKIYLAFATFLFAIGYFFIYPCQLANKLTKGKIRA